MSRRFTKTCSATGKSGCPKNLGYICASTDVWPQQQCGVDDAGKSETGCLCEVKFPPDPYDAGSVGGGTGGGGGSAAGGGTGGTGGAGGGGGVVKDAGPPVDYCTEIRTILAQKCLGTCHSSQMVYPNSPKDFRLDYYESLDGGLPGVKDKGPRVFARASDNTMPPPVEQAVFPPYTAAEKLTLARWLDAGSPFGSGSCETPGPKDGGMDGGGAPDAGPQFLFATDIQPILTTSCATVGCHTGATPPGGLNLSAGNAYNALVNINTSAGCNAGGSKRVLAFDFKNSMLWQKLTPDGGYCNNSMPRNLVILRQQQPNNFAKIEGWIGQGAKNN